MRRIEERLVLEGELLLGEGVRLKASDYHLAPKIRLMAVRTALRALCCSSAAKSLRTERSASRSL
jgi:hypothetical protein